MRSGEQAGARDGGPQVPRLQCPHSTPTGAAVLADSRTKPKPRDELTKKSKLTPSV